MTTIEQLDVSDLSMPPAPHEDPGPCVLTYEGNHQPFYDTVATQGAVYLNYLEKLYQSGLVSFTELSVRHNLTVCALVAIADRVRLDDLEVGDQLFSLVGDMFAVEHHSVRHSILTAEICTDAVDFIQSHTKPDPERCFEYSNKLNQIFDFS